MQDIECQQLVIPLPKRRRVVAAVVAQTPPPITCASLVSMYLPVPSIDVPCARGLYGTMVHRVLARRVADVPAVDAPGTLPLADDPCSVVAGMLILAAQSAIAPGTAPKTPEAPNTLAVVLSSNREQSSATVDTREVPLLPPELCRTQSTARMLGAVLQELGPVVPTVSVSFDTAFAEQQLARDLVHTPSIPVAAPPSFVSLVLDDVWTQHDLVQELDVPVLRMDEHEHRNDNLHPAGVVQALAGDLVLATTAEDTCFLTPSITFDQLLCKEGRMQTSAPMSMSGMLMDQLLRCPPSRPSSVEAREAPLLMQCSSTEPCWTQELARECRPSRGDGSEMPPEFPLAEQSWSAVVEKDLAPPWSTVARLCIPELPAALSQSHNLTQVPAIAAALLTPEQEQTALRQRLELSLPPFWSSTRMAALKQNLCLRGIGTTAGTCASQPVHATAAEVLLRHEATLVTDRPAPQREEVLALGHHDVPVLPSPGRLSASPLDNFIRLRGCTPRKVDSQPVSLPASVSTTVPLTLQSCVTPWHVCLSFHPLFSLSRLL